MRILLTNDDGIHAPGIVSLHTAIEGLGERWTAAPLTVQSAAGHGITYTDPLMVEPVQVTKNFGGMAVDGRPADCVKLAIRNLWPEHFGENSRPDLTISGMNSGANVGINILYSGTVAAAIESAFLGVPSIAVSLYLRDRNRIFWDRAAAIAREVIDKILATRPLTAHEVLNVNVPAPIGWKTVGVLCGKNHHEGFETCGVHKGKKVILSANDRVGTDWWPADRSPGTIPKRRHQNVCWIGLSILAGGRSQVVHLGR